MNVPQSPFSSGLSELKKPKLLDLNLPFYRKLGRTDLTVSCLGIGGGTGISSEDTLYAFEQGINYFFFSSDLHHYMYKEMSNALRQLCGRGSSVREKVNLATVTYIKSPNALVPVLADQFWELNFEYIDVFFWGWFEAEDAQTLNNCLQLTPDLRGPGAKYQRWMEQMVGTSERLKKMGLVRYIGVSFHDYDLAQQWLDSPLVDVVMVRHNVLYRTAQSKIFSRLDANNSHRPGIVTFRATGSNILMSRPVELPEGCWQPSVQDLYRYSLSQNSVDICLTGVNNREQIDTAINGVKQGKLTPAEIDYLNLYADLCKNPQQVNKPITPERIVYR